MAITLADYRRIFHKVGSQSVTFEISDMDTTDGTYHYYGYLCESGAWIIQRKTVATNAYRYFAGQSGYKTAVTGGWAAKATHTYVYFNEVHTL